jgi:hypothetical protein
MAAAVLPSAGKVGADTTAYTAAAVLPSAGKVGADAAAYRAAAMLPSAEKIGRYASPYTLSKVKFKTACLVPMAWSAVHGDSILHH